MANPIASLAGAWAEPLTFLLMLLSFGFLVIAKRWPIGLASAVGSAFWALLSTANSSLFGIWSKGLFPTWTRSWSSPRR